MGEATGLSGGVAKRLARRMDTLGILVRRWAGSIIDFIVLAVLLAPGIVLAAMYEMTWPPLLGVAAALAYFPVTEGVWGRSAGKFVTGTIVVDEDGNLPGIGPVIIRTLLRLLEANPFLIGAVPAGIALLATPHKQRLGDLAAGTYVVAVRELDQARLSDPIHDVFD